jgi:hypothetical protein
MVKNVVDFKGWKWPAPPEFGQNVYPLLNDFVKTRDLRRSRLAQEFVTREDPEDRAERARGLFQWADKDRSGNLSLEEFAGAIGGTTAIPSEPSELPERTGAYMWVPGLRQWVPVPAAGVMPGVGRTRTPQ